MVWLISKMKIYILHYICHMKFKSPCRTACRQTISENSSMSKNQPCMFSPRSDTAPLWNKWSRRSFTGSVLPNCTANILSLQQLSLPASHSLRAGELWVGPAWVWQAADLSCSSHCAIHNPTGTPREGKLIKENFLYDHGFTFKGFQESSQCPLFTCFRGCTAVAQLSATE